jgi:ribonuclease E
MLEPDDTTNTNTTDAGEASTAQPGAVLPDGAAAIGTAPQTVPPAKTPRKRAPRKKAAATPEAAPDAGRAPDATTGPETIASQTAPAEATAPPAKAPRTRARKAVVSTTQIDAPADVAVESAPAADERVAEAAAPAKSPRKRTSRKAAAALADAAPGTETNPEAGTDAEPAMAAPVVLFQPPEAVVPPAAPRTRRTRKAAAAVSEAAPVVDEQLPVDGEDVASVDDEPDAADADLTVAEDAEDETAEPLDVKEAAIEQASGARRRRRRGRRGRGANAAITEAGDEDEDEETEAIEPPSDEVGETGGSTRRRRRRQRGGGAGDGASDDPPNTVVHVRESKQDDDGVRGVKGSTRLEAKRQRRRDGRETVRRRAPILSEFEFLARREAVDRVMAVRQTGDRTQIAVLEDGVLVEHYVTRASSSSYVGNVYLGRVQNVLPSMEAAFVDIGKGRNGVLYAGEVNWDAAGLEGKSRAIENALKSGDAVLVQVTKDPIGHKGARLTSQISLPGRFLVYVPGGGMTGISRRLPDTERHRLKSILKKIVPEDAGVIVRTAAEGASEEDLTRDVERLQAQWEQISKKGESGKGAPSLVHGEPDLAIRVIRDVFNEDFKQVIIQGSDTAQTISDYVSGVAPDLADRIVRHTGESDLFHDLRVDEGLMKALDRKVWLPSGGSLIIDRTEAMTVIDVNTGRFVGAGGNLEQTVTRNNLEAAEEIVRQLRLRDIGGIVVIDFIDMVLESNRELVLRRLTECLGRDRTKHQVAEVTSLGLVQMTRKRVGEGLLEAFSETCSHCNGRGVIIHPEPVERASSSHQQEDEDRPAKSKRKRGSRASAAAEPAPVEPPANAERRAAALQAMQAIHRAANHDEVDGEIAEAALVEAAAELAAVMGEADLVPELSSVEGAVPDAVDVTVEPDAGDAAGDPAGESAAGSDGAVPLAATGTDSNAATELPAPAAAAPRRRRRGASRPAGPPTGS